jgi:hypothetical protein
MTAHLISLVFIMFVVGAGAGAGAAGGLSTTLPLARTKRSKAACCGAASCWVC